MKNRLKSELQELQTTLTQFQEIDREYNNDLINSNIKLNKYMKQEDYQNSQIELYTKVKSLLDIKQMQDNIKDISILKHMIDKMYIIEMKTNNLELAKTYKEHVKRKTEQLEEYVKYGRIFTK